MEFVSWHYSEGLEFYANRYFYTLRSIVQYYSLPLLLKSLFAPWKRLIILEKEPGFNLGVYLSNLSFNLISRGIGAFVRVVLFVAGCLTFIFVAVAGLLGFLLWIVFPFVSYPAFIRIKNSPSSFANKIWKNMKGRSPANALFKSQAGEFISVHLGVPAEKFIEAARPVRMASNKKPDSVYQIFEILFANDVWDSLFLRQLGLVAGDVLRAAKWWDTRKLNNSISLEPPKFFSPGLGRELLYGYTPILRKYSSDMGAKTDFSHHLIGRGGVVSRIERALTSGKSVILTGDPGVGKKTVVYEFAQRAARGEFGNSLAYRRVIELDYNFVFSETHDKNRKKQDMVNILQESSSAGNIILVLRDLHRLTDSKVEDMDLTDVLEAQLEKGKLMIITISTKDDYEKYLARNSRLRKFFEVVEVLEPSREEAMDILLEAADVWERKKNLVITIPALSKILIGSDKYITDTPFPEKALELLDAVVFLEEQKGSDKIITEDDVNTALSEKTGISFANLNKTETGRLSNLEEIIHERLVNQDEAVSLIAKTLRSKTLGVIDSKRPTGSFLFLGPTGVGKTETAKVLAKVYFGSSDKIIRFDMAEYVGGEGLERLIGSLKNNQPGALTTAIKNNPASLLLLDEIEKAPPEIFNLFLAMLDEGIITDVFGKKINCRNLFIIATSNAGAIYIRELVHSNETNLQAKVVDQILKDGVFSPEFINRFDGVVVYEPLSRDNLIKIARILLAEMSENLIKRNITLKFSEDAVEKLAHDGFEPEYGARPMRRIIELSIGDLIGRALLSEEVVPGDQITIVPADGPGNFEWIKNDKIAGE